MAMVPLNEVLKGEGEETPSPASSQKAAESSGSKGGMVSLDSVLGTQPESTSTATKGIAKSEYPSLPEGALHKTVELVKDKVIKQTKKDLGVLENVASLASGLTGFHPAMALSNLAVSGSNEIADWVFKGKAPTWQSLGERINQNLQKLTYVPKTEEGIKQAENIDRVLKTIPIVVDAIDDKTGESLKKSFPNSYAMLQTAGEMAPYVVAGKVYHTLVKNGVKPKVAENVVDSVIPPTDSLPVPSKGLSAKEIKKVPFNPEQVKTDLQKVKELTKPKETQMELNLPEKEPVVLKNKQGGMALTDPKKQVIAIDIDGVFNTPEYVERTKQLFDPEKVKLWNDEMAKRGIEKPDVVLASSHRATALLLDDFKEAQTLVDEAGLNARVVGVTPDFGGDTPMPAKSGFTVVREHEINAWQHTFGDRLGTKIAAIFDDRMDYNKLKKIQVQPLETNGIDINSFSRLDKLLKTELPTVQDIAREIGNFDLKLKAHGEHVATISAKVGKLLGLPDNVIDDIVHASWLHDIGKTRVKSEILNSPTSLTPEQFKEIKEHVNIDKLPEFIDNSRISESIKNAIKYHHEKYDGTGYQGVKGENIPIEAQVISAADVYDALTTGDRSYRKPATQEELLATFEKMKGHNFDSKVLDALFEAVGLKPETVKKAKVEGFEEPVARMEIKNKYLEDIAATEIEKLSPKEQETHNELLRILKNERGSTSIFDHFFEIGRKGVSKINPGIIAYHGTPHTFEEFSTKHVGKGEGAQGWGKGLYFTDSKKVAEYYRKMLTDLYKGKIEELNGFIYYAKQSLNEIGISKEKTSELMDNINEAQRKIKEIKEAKLDTGNLYKVNLLPKPNEFLNWDTKLSEQNKTKIKKLGIEDIDTLTGEEVYKKLEVKYGEETNLKLLEVGIRGTKYLDANSRKEGKGTYNYVIYNDKDVEILRDTNPALDKISDSLRKGISKIVPGIIEEGDRKNIPISSPKERIAEEYRKLNRLSKDRKVSIEEILTKETDMTPEEVRDFLVIGRDLTKGDRALERSLGRDTTAIRNALGMTTGELKVLTKEVSGLEEYKDLTYGDRQKVKEMLLYLYKSKFGEDYKSPKKTTIRSASQEANRAFVENSLSSRGFFGVKEITGRIASDGEQYLRTHGVAAKELADNLSNVRLLSDLKFSDLYATKKQLVSKLTDKEKLLVQEIVDTVPTSKIDEYPASERVKETAKFYREAFNSISEDMSANGVKITNLKGEKILYEHDPEAPYWPRYYNSNELLRPGERRNRAIKNIISKGYADNVGQAEVLLDKILSRRMNSPKYGNMEYAREFDIPEYERDINIVFDNYFQNATKRIEVIKAFGQQGKKALELLGNIKRESGDYVYKYATDVHKRTVGSGHSSDPIASAISDVAISYEVLTKMGRAGLRNLGQSANTIGLAYNKSVLKALGHIFSDPKNAMDRAQRAAAMLHSYANEFAKFEKGEEVSSEFLLATKLAEGMKAVSDKSLSLSGFKQSEIWNRLFAAETGREYAVDLFRDLKNATRDSRSYKVTAMRLEKLGLDPNQLLSQTELSEFDRRTAAYNFVRQTQFVNDAMSLPRWVSSENPWIRFLTLFKTFGIHQAKLVYRTLKSDPVMASKLLTTMLITGGITAEAIDTLTQKIRDDESVLQKVSRYLASGGGFGLWADTVEEAMKSSSGLSEALTGVVIGDIGTKGFALKKGLIDGEWDAFQRTMIKDIPIVGPTVYNTMDNNNMDLF